MSAVNRTCTSCHTPIPDGAAFCPICGSAVPTHMLKEAERPRVKLGRSGKSSLGLPPDLLDIAAQRLGIAAIVYAVAYLLAYLPVRLSWGWAGLEVWDLLATFFIVLSLGVFFLTRFGNIESRVLLNVGLVYEVVGAAGIEITTLSGDWSPDVVVLGLSWVCVWIILFPLIVPSTLGKTFLAAFAAASMTLLMYAIAVALGAAPLPTLMVVSRMMPNYVCVGIAVVASRIVHRMGSAIGKARRMGSYLLVARLGEGGMGEVWRAKHRLLARPAAIKLIRPQMLGAGGNDDSAAALRRFEREAQATALLRSPHTIELFDFGVTDDGTFYYVMELLDGLDLETLVQWFGPLPPQRTVHLLKQVCGSLGEAHDQGLIHRDIKPANIFVCRYGRETDFVKVLDFGLVKPDSDSDTDEVTVTGVAMGTPGTMAPDQLLGTHPLDARTDIYGLGCVGYWLLTGEPVFKGDTVIQLIAHHVHTVPTPPSERVKSAIPKELDNAILACLEKDPDRRPQTVDLLLEMLTLCVDGGDWTAEESNEWWNERIPEETAKTLEHPRILVPSLVDSSNGV